MRVFQPAELSDKHTQQAVEVLYDAMRDSPLNTATGDSKEYIQAGYADRVRAAIIDTSSLVAIDDEGEVRGVAHFFDAGVPFGQMKDGSSPVSTTPKLSAEEEAWQKNEFFPMFKNFAEKAFTIPRQTSSIYLSVIAVSPTHQRQGIGRMMLEQLFEIADEKQVEIALMTQKEENVRMYEKFGFEVERFEECKVKTSMVPNWGMLRIPCAREVDV